MATKDLIGEMRRAHEAGQHYLALALLTAGVIFASGCAASADNTYQASLDDDFRLQIGQSALVVTVGLEVGFQAVTADSRCGKGETCVWEGDATVRVWLQMDGGAKEERELHTGSRMPTAVDFANFSIGLVALHPAPVSGRAIKPAEYVATLRVVRGVFGGQVVY